MNVSRSANWITESLQAKVFLGLLQRNMTGLRVTQYQTEEFNAGSRKKTLSVTLKRRRSDGRERFFFLIIFGSLQPCDTLSFGRCRRLGEPPQEAIQRNRQSRRKKTLASEHTRCTTPTPSCSCCKKDNKNRLSGSLTHSR